MSHQQTSGGNRLRTLREAYGKTQLDVELDASLGIGYLQRLERGKVQHPERDTLDRILEALGAKFAERREVLESFGYKAAISIPDDSEIAWAVEVFHAQVKGEAIPAYLLDCTHRLLAWNSLVPRLFGYIPVSATMLMPKLIFDPIYAIAPSVINSETFFAAQIRTLQYEHLRCGDETWYNGFVDDMRQYRLFDEHWNKGEATPQIPIRPLTSLKLNTRDGIAQFRLMSETFVHDHRFRVIYYLPADSATIRQCHEWQS